MKLIKELPDPFLMKDDSHVVTLEDWNLRRQEIKDMMINIQYGSMPSSPEEVIIKNLESKTLDGGETQEELYFEFVPKKDQPKIKYYHGMEVIGYPQHQPQEQHYLVYRILILLMHQMVKFWNMII